MIGQLAKNIEIGIEIEIRTESENAKDCITVTDKMQEIERLIARKKTEMCIAGLYQAGVISKTIQKSQATVKVMALEDRIVIRRNKVIIGQVQDSLAA